MVNIFGKGLIFSSMLISLAYDCFAEGKTLSKLKKWVQKAEVAAVEKKIVVPRRILFLKMFQNDKLDLPDIDYDELTALGYINFLNADDFEINKKLNVKPWEAYKKPTPLETILTAFKHSGANLIISAPNQDAIWTMLTLDAGRHPLKLHVAKGLNFEESELILKWIEDALGYQGYILDQKNQLVLVAARNSLLTPTVKVLVANQSTNKIQISEKQAVAMLELVEAEGCYAIFKVLPMKNTSNAIPIGSKVMFAK